MSLHACSVTNSWFGRQADFQSGAYSGNQRFVQREPQWLLLLSFLSKRLVVMSMKLLLRGDAANTAFNLLHEAPICDSFFSMHPIHKAIIDTATQSHLVNKSPCTDGKSFDIETHSITLGRRLHQSSAAGCSVTCLHFVLEYFRARQQFAALSPTCPTLTSCKQTFL